VTARSRAKPSDGNRRATADRHGDGREDKPGELEQPDGDGDNQRE